MLLSSISLAGQCIGYDNSGVGGMRKDLFTVLLPALQVWDAWQRFVQPLVGQVPMFGGTG